LFSWMRSSKYSMLSSFLIVPVLYAACAIFSLIIVTTAKQRAWQDCWNLRWDEVIR
jgi:hypothetical protein